MTTDRSTDRGFTLPEVLIAVVMIGLISTIIAGVFTVIVRTQPTAEARTDDARSLLGLTTWFPGDVNSTPRQPAGAASPEWWNLLSGTASGCSSSPGGTNLLRLRWTETNGSSVKYEASYRYINDNGWKIKRVSCVVGQPASVISLTSGLPDPSTNPVAVAFKTDPVTGDVIGASMVVTTIAGDTTRVDAVSESTNETLPPPPTVVTTVPAPTTSTSTTTSTTTTTTTAPPGPTSSTTSTTPTTTSSTSTTTTTVPCSVVSTSVTPATVANQAKNNGNNDTESQLTEKVVVTVNGLSGNCSGLQLRFSLKANPAPPGQEQSLLFAGSLSITFQVLSTERWEDGTHTFRLYDGNRGVYLSTTTNLVVT